ncbi:MAG TPA: HEAT repeat domain-containing protein [Thermomicrobiales bacterium]|nr:HEAT repeat domain-containing protein [Thermomicrobiales bacterium]
MSTSSSQFPEAGSRAAVERVLADWLASTETTTSVEGISDLSGAGAEYLAERWPEIPVEARRSLVRAMTADAEEQIEHNFNRALLIAIRDQDAQIRLEALEGLAELESQAFLETLLSVIDREPDARVRTAEAMALGRFALQCELETLEPELANRVRTTLLHLIESDESSDVRRRALEAAGYFAEDADVIREIEVAYESGNHALRVSALHAMGRQADTRWLEIVHEELTNDDPELRYEAVVATGSIGDERSVVELIDRLRDEDVEVQLAAIASLGEIGGRLAISALRRLTEDDSPAIVDAAEAALEEAQLTSDPLRPLM